GAAPQRAMARHAGAAIMSLVAPSLAGTTIGRYRLIDKLGQGAMATVYRAEDPQLGRQVAIEVMHPFIAERSDMSSRFERDVKAENCMFDKTSDDPRRALTVRVVLCDFGIARVAAAEGMTATGAIMGSPAYMSPEQASGVECDVRSDQFSLGALLYQLATGA